MVVELVGPYCLQCGFGMSFYVLVISTSLPDVAGTFCGTISLQNELQPRLDITRSNVSDSVCTIQYVPCAQRMATFRFWGSSVSLYIIGLIISGGGVYPMHLIAFPAGE